MPPGGCSEWLVGLWRRTRVPASYLNWRGHAAADVSIPLWEGAGESASQLCHQRRRKGAWHRIPQRTSPPAATQCARGNAAGRRPRMAPNRLPLPSAAGQVRERLSETGDGHHKWFLSGVLGCARAWPGLLGCVGACVLYDRHTQTALPDITATSEHTIGAAQKAPSKQCPNNNHPWIDPVSVSQKQL